MAELTEVGITGGLGTSGTGEVPTLAPVRDLLTAISDKLSTIQTKQDEQTDFFTGWDAEGAAQTRDDGPYWASLCGVAGEAFSSADATTAVAVSDAPTAGQKLCIDDVIVSVGATALAVSLVEETSLDLMFPILYMPANSTVQITVRGKRKLLVANKKLMVDASAAGNISILTTYHSEA